LPVDFSFESWLLSQTKTPFLFSGTHDVRTLDRPLFTTIRSKGCLDLTWSSNHLISFWVIRP
jgi:hypothetical protein